ncbi:MAG: ATP-dependent protease LonB [Euryarchaeota archaeon HGW-Euryarchaeota-1]|nr:MAG: ATP-dependent protease LonB [Euryarchaeota archaeon HGW-Euryarchaeota-1]
MFERYLKDKKPFTLSITSQGFVEEVLPQVPKNFKTTDEIAVPKKTFSQIIGQERSKEILMKAAKQRRNLLLIGSPGTGKSMLGKALSELLPEKEIPTVMAMPNERDENNPKIAVISVDEAETYRQSFNKQNRMLNTLFKVLMVVSIIGALFYAIETQQLLVGLIAGAVIVIMFKMLSGSTKNFKLNILERKKHELPFYDATGVHSGALLGDVKHDPFQSGGLGTPPHERVEFGLIHRAHNGVLFIDEITNLPIEAQTALLTAMQEKKLSITGRNPMSGGATVHTEPVPCGFVLVAAGNIYALEKLHPALRSRIIGYGYEIYMEDAIEDTEENRQKLAVFVAQEVTNDGKIPHFTYDAVERIIQHAQIVAGEKGKLSAHFRTLGGIVRSAGDIALFKNKPFANKSDVEEAIKKSCSIEDQISEKYCEKLKNYEAIEVTGEKIGRVNGLAVLGESRTSSGVVLPILSTITKPHKKGQGKFIVTGNLQKIALESIQNIEANIKQFTGKNLSDYDTHIQFLYTYEGVEGDSASISVATAIFSALEKIPIKQNVAMTGSLSIQGEVLPIGGVNIKVLAAIEQGFDTVIIPFRNLNDVVLPKSKLSNVTIVVCKTLYDVLSNALVFKKEPDFLKNMKKTLSF